jgi:uncharacterized protein YndB with AHSA1/START domain
MGISRTWSTTRAEGAVAHPKKTFGRVSEAAGAERLDGRERTVARLLVARRSKIMREKTSATLTNTVRLHRVLAAKPEKVYRAFLEADAMAKWLPPSGFTCTVQHLDPKVGGTFRMSFKNFTTGKSHSFGGEFLELVPHELIRYTDRFDDPNLPGVIRVTVTLKAVSVGTEINIEQTGLPTVIPLEACYIGWQQSLSQLALLVEPDIPG